MSDRALLFLGKIIYWLLYYYTVFVNSQNAELFFYLLPPLLKMYTEVHEMYPFPDIGSNVKLSKPSLDLRF